MMKVQLVMMKAIPNADSMNELRLQIKLKSKRGKPSEERTSSAFKMFDEDNFS